MLKVYLFMIVGWLVLTIIGVSLRRRVLGRYILKASYVVLILFCIEFACVMAFERLRYVQAVARYSRMKEDFADPSHLNAAGNRKFAQLVLGAVKDQSKEKRS